ncbi:MAG: DNA-3-methyladenine glycosylase [Phormidesmis sp. RL_2_1]|nr:DNA-3-methyladenine glycosylase [Phormidesmis sp. RL_2_1]
MSASTALPPSPLPAEWFNRAAATVAPDLLGCTLVRTVNGETIRGQIVETEAYEAGDPAMAAYRRLTQRNALVFGPAGVAYVYRIYRQYHCLNIVTDRDGLASTILIRAVDLEQWPSWITSSQERLVRVAAGPGKLCRTLQIDDALKGVKIHPNSGLWVESRAPQIAEQLADKTLAITQTTRIGLSKGTEIPWRWYLPHSPAVSRQG